MKTGELIRARRLELGLTQRALSERCGIAEPTLRRYEAGKLNPKLGTCQTIATALEVPVVYLLDVSPDTKNANMKIRQMIENARKALQELKKTGGLQEQIEVLQRNLTIAEELQQEYFEKAFQEDALNKSIAEIKATADTAKRQRRTSKLVAAFDQLNDVGQATAIERVEELALIPKYHIVEPTHE